MKRRTVYGLGLGLGALLRIPAALRLSPWPGALLIRQLFNHGDAQTLARLARHVPAGLRQQRDLAYGPDPDERLDLYLPAAAGTHCPHWPGSTVAAGWPAVAWRSATGCRSWPMPAMPACPSAIPPHAATPATPPRCAR